MRKIKHKLQFHHLLLRFLQYLNQKKQKFRLLLLRNKQRPLMWTLKALFQNRRLKLWIIFKPNYQLLLLLSNNSWQIIFRFSLSNHLHQMLFRISNNFSRLNNSRRNKFKNHMQRLASSQQRNYLPLLLQSQQLQINSLLKWCRCQFHSSHRHLWIQIWWQANFYLSRCTQTSRWMQLNKTSICHNSSNSLSLSQTTNQQEMLESLILNRSIDAIM